MYNIDGNISTDNLSVGKSTTTTGTTYLIKTNTKENRIDILTRVGSDPLIKLEGVDDKVSIEGELYLDGAYFLNLGNETYIENGEIRRGRDSTKSPIRITFDGNGAYRVLAKDKIVLQSCGNNVHIL